MTDTTLWGSRRGAGNRGRIDQDAGLPRAETIVARTGADLRGVHRIALPGGELILVHAGTVLSGMDPGGETVWMRGDLGVSRIVATLPQIDAVVVIGRKDRVHLLGIGDGLQRWSYRHPEGRDVSAAGSVRVIEYRGEPLLLVAPSYSTDIVCVELRGAPRVRWTHDLTDTIDAGFGPVMIAADLLGVGEPQLVLSSRTGTSYGEGDTVANERLVLGREDGHLYQAVLDLADGHRLTETSYRPDPGDYPAARPYGLLQAGPSAGGDIALVSCQVEEYAAVTAGDGELRRRWGWFVEKDWPTDLQELRPQTTSIADVTGDGRPRLVVGHWDGVTWATLVLDVLGPASTGSTIRLDGRYFWGTADLDGDGVAELVTTLETQRRPSERSRIEVVDARTEQVLGALDEATLVTTDDETLPQDRVFHADRRGAALLADGDGRVGIVLVAEGRTMWWHLGADAAPPRVILGHPVSRVDDRLGGRSLGDAAGRIHLLDGDLAVTGTLAVEGRTARPLLYASDRVHVVVDAAGGRIMGTSGAGWSIDGAVAALHRSADGEALLISVDPAPGASVVAVAELGPEGPRTRASWAVQGLVDGVLAYGDGPTVVALRRTGPHTAGVAAFDAAGTPVWSDDAHGVHANEPLAFEDDGWRVATDDHGVLTIRDGVTGAVQTEHDWTAAYTTPLAVTLDGRPLLVRADGTHGLELCTTDGERIWRHGYEIFAVHPGTSVLTGGPADPVLAVSHRDGRIEVIRLRDGELLRVIEIGDQTERRALLGVGGLVLAGTLAGELLCLDPLTGAERWRRRYPASVDGLAAVAFEGRVHVAVATADGIVRLLELDAP